jgi:serine/threonine protein kinase
MPPSNEEALFALALAKPASERAAWLDRECGDDKALRARLDALLAAHEKPETLLATQAESARPTIKLAFAEEPADEAVGQTLGRYKLLERVGEGGCGVVYVAEQTEPVRRRVALKVIKLGMDTRQVVARFEAERQALAMMEHPNIAKVLDAGTTGEPDRSAGWQPAVSPTGSRQGAANSEAVDDAELSQAASPAIQQTTSLRYESNIRAGRPYFVMELVRGIRITDYCDQANLTTKERLELFIKVCQAIQHAHQKGIIHRDIKPSNILVTLHDGVPVPKVIDFGIAKATEGRLTDNTVYTQLHQFIGTPAYMSPEQAEMSGLDIDTRSDIYSLGVLLYELLAGSTPFDAKELMASGIDAMRKTIREKDPVRPSTKLSQTLVAANVSSLKSSGAGKPKTDEEVRADSRRLLRVKETITLLRGDLDWIVMKCLEKDRQRRYDTANALSMDLKRHLNNEPVTACPPSAAYRFHKAFRRNKLVFTAGTAVALALVLGIVGTTVGQLRANKQRQVAQAAEREQSKLREVAVKALDGEKEQRAQAETEKQRADAQAQKAIANEEQSRRLLYAADMNLAQQSLKLNNLGKVRLLLDRHRPVPGEEDLRGWEWRYLWERTRSSALVTLTNRPVRGFDVSFSPDGTRLAAGWWDGRVELWDVPGRRVIHRGTEGRLRPCRRDGSEGPTGPRR